MQTCTTYKTALRTLPLFEACGYKASTIDALNVRRVRKSCGPSVVDMSASRLTGKVVVTYAHFPNECDAPLCRCGINEVGQLEVDALIFAGVVWDGIRLPRRFPASRR
jgi:hypothetical protein